MTSQRVLAASRKRSKAATRLLIAVIVIVDLADGRCGLA
jgi:hypothetical protein